MGDVTLAMCHDATLARDDRLLYYYDADSQTPTRETTRETTPRTRRARLTFTRARDHAFSSPTSTPEPFA